MATTQTTTTRNLLSARPATTAPSQAPQQRVRPYKDFLTPALHRRFTQAALIVLAACYATSIVLAPPPLLWFWNPISLTTIRALLLFIPCLAVFIVQVTNLHFGAIHASSQAEAVTKAVGGWKGWHTLAWYLFSAVFFGEVYIWTRAEGAGLEWVDRGREYERARVNENPMFLRAVWICIAIAQTILHLIRDEDRILQPAQDQDPIAHAKSEEQASKWRLPSSLWQLWSSAPKIGGRMMKMAVPGFAFTLPVYFILLRPWFWPYFHSVTRTFFRSLPPNAKPTGLQHMTTLAWQAVTSSAILVALWETSAAAFRMFVARPPLAKSGAEPLTGSIGSGSKDPNGSLLSGLRSRKEVPRTYAFWELSLICQFFEQRRKTIYVEVDRIGGSTWTQISKLCLDELVAIQTRIRDYQTQSIPSAPAPTTSQSNLMPPSQQPEALGMPNIADRGVVSDGAVYTAPSASWDRTVGNVAKAVGQSPGSPNPVLRTARRAIESSAQHGLNRQHLEKEANGYLQSLLQTPLGEPLRQTFARRVKAIVLGTPESAQARIVYASKALSMLCVQSLREDDYGQVAKSIAVVIRTYVETITIIESFVRSLEPHWSDVFFTQRHRELKNGGELDEVVIVIGELRKGLEDVVLAFGEYASSVGVSKKELREARECIAAGR